MQNYQNKKNNSIIISYILLAIFFILPGITFSATTSNSDCTTDPTGKLIYCPLEPDAFGETLTGATSLGDFLSQAFNFLLAGAAALSVVMIVWGGVEIMLSESVTSKDDGKKRIKNAIYGLLLALFSWLILYTINPEILNFKL